MSSENQSVANHILPTSANLLGICFVIFSIGHFQNYSENTWLDEFSAIAIIIFLTSSIFSYMSLRNTKYRKFEKVADISFLLGILTMAIPAILIAIRFMK